MRKQLLTLMLLAFTMMASAEQKSLSFTSSDMSFHWVDPSEGDPGFWYFGCSDESGNYMLRLAYGSESTEQTGSFGYKDLNQDYSYLTYENYEGEEPVYQDIKFQAGSTFAVTKYETYVHITGTLKGDDGIDYVINANCPLPQPLDETVEGATLTMAEYDSDYKQWDVRFKDADEKWKISLSIKSEDGKFEGTYTEKDMSEDGCHVEDLNSEDNYPFDTMNVTFALPDGNEDPADGLEVTGSGMDKDGNKFTFHMLKHAPIKPKDVKDIEVEVKTAEWPSDRTGGSYYEVTEKDNPSNTWVLALTTTEGEATEKLGEGIDTTMTYRDVNGVQTRFNNGTIKQTFDSENLEVKVESSLVMNDSIQYNFNFTTNVASGGEQTIKFYDLQVDRSYEDYGTVCLNASTDSCSLYVQLLEYPDIPAEYTAETCEPQIITYSDGEFNYINSLALVYARTEQTEGDAKPKFYAKFLADNHKLYTIEASYVEPAVEKDTTIVVSNCSSGTDENGRYYTYEDANGNIWIKTLGTESTGTFGIDQLDGGSKFSFYSPKGFPRDYYLSKADFTVTQKDKVLTLTGTCQAGPYRIHLTMNYEIEGLNNDNYNQDIDATYTQSDFVEVTPKEGEYGEKTIYVKFLSKERKDELCLLFYPEVDELPETLPAGDYEIGGWSNFVQAGSPDDETGEVTPSFYAKVDDEGTMQTPLWYLYSGTVNVAVAEDGNTTITVTGKNSYYRTVKATATYNKSTGIRDVNVNGDKKDGKFIKNGQIIIRKGGMEFNVMGQKRK